MWCEIRLDRLEIFTATIRIVHQVIYRDTTSINGTMSSILCLNTQLGDLNGHILFIFTYIYNLTITWLTDYYFNTCVITYTISTHTRVWSSLQAKLTFGQ